MSFLPDVVKHNGSIKRSIITMFTLHTLFFIMHLSEKKNDDNILTKHCIAENSRIEKCRLKAVQYRTN